TARMEFTSHVIEPPDQGRLDMHVDIFQFNKKLESPLFDALLNFLQRQLNLLALDFFENADGGQHLRMSDRTLNIMGVKTLIEADTFGKAFDTAIGTALKNAASGRVCQRCLATL